MIYLNKALIPKLIFVKVLVCQLLGEDKNKMYKEIVGQLILVVPFVF